MERPTEHWRKYLDGAPENVAVLPLAPIGPRHGAGWCTYDANLEGAPDVEVVCGGWNSKLPTAAAVWRQGHLLHFGFQQAPDELNEAGRALLENSIHYVARFTDDRPIGHTVSAFSSKTRPEQRRYLDSMLDSGQATAEGLAERFFSGALGEVLAAMDDAAAVKWTRSRRAYLVPGADGRLFVAEDLAALGIDVRSPRALVALRAELEGQHAPEAVAALARHVPEGPTDGSPAEWRDFFDARGGYLFFSEVAGCVFLLDPLAEARGVPSAELRGPARASR